MLNSIASLLISFMLLSSCNNAANNNEPQKNNDSSSMAATDTTKPPQPGSDSDEHGCKPSAGYTWSVVKNNCVRLFESGIKMEPQDPKLDQTTVAYLIFSDDKIRVEIFLPTQKKPVIIRKSSGEGQPAKWANGPLALSETNGIYSLEDEGKLLYRSSVK